MNKENGLVWLHVPIFLLTPTTLNTDVYDKSKPFEFAICDAVDGYSPKVLKLFVGSSNNDPKVVTYHFANCVIDLQLAILQFRRF